jgi:hypothetical protein
VKNHGSWKYQGCLMFNSRWSSTWLCGLCGSCTSPLISFGTALYMLANVIWIMSTPRWCICVCSHDCWCRILPLHWTPLRYEFWVQGSSFPKRCWNCQNIHLFFTCCEHLHNLNMIW